MPREWTDKDERKYRHIKQSQKKRGSSETDAKEIAARTVNKDRRLQRRTQNRKAQGTGNPKEPLENRTVEELRNRAADLNVSGRSRMRKQELIDAIRDAHG